MLPAERGRRGVEREKMEENRAREREMGLA